MGDLEFLADAEITHNKDGKINKIAYYDADYCWEIDDKEKLQNIINALQIIKDNWE